VDARSSSTVDVNGRYTDYVALRKGLEGAKWYISTYLNSPDVALGHIGCNPMDKGDWNVVRQIVSEVFTDYDGKIVIINVLGA
jgi:hypothetical protein